MPASNTPAGERLSSFNHQGFTSLPTDRIQQRMAESENSNDEPNKPLTARQTYNVITDTAIGPNVRLKDNLIQAVLILASVLIGGGVGAMVNDDRLTGLLAGVFIGLVAGLLVSGMGLMIYRAVKHLKGQHD
jgi:hypothetical protein